MNPLIHQAHMLTNNIRLRVAHKQDTQTIQNLLGRILATYQLNCDPVTDADLADLERHYFQRGGYFGVLEDLQQSHHPVIGTLALYPLDHTQAEIRKMYLEQAYRGQGLGKACLQFLIELARNKGLSRLVLETNRKLTAAIGLYERQGFTPMVSEHLSERSDQAYELEL